MVIRSGMDKTKPVYFRLPPAIYDWLLAQANTQNRTLANMVEVLVTEAARKARKSK